MKEFYFPGKAVAVLSFAFLFSTIASEISVFAQRNRTILAERRQEEFNRQMMEEERQRLYRDLKSGKNTGNYRVVSPAKIEQVKKDFAEMQTGYNQIVVEMTNKQNLNFDTILPAIKEIHHSAARLKDSLLLPELKPENENARSPQTDESAEIEKTLLTLRKHIYNFVTNPLFEAQGALNLELADKAGRDLNKIIELSESVRKHHEKSKKSHHR